MSCRTGCLFIIVSIMFVTACSRSPYSATNKVYRKQANTFASRLREQPDTEPNDTIKVPDYSVETTNFTMRKPNFVIIHHTAQQDYGQTLKTFTLPKTEVSAHYLIGKDGTVYHLLNDYLRAHHAGAGKWGNVTDMNSCSIGIELDNNGFEPFSDQQIASLLSLLARLKQAYNIPAANFIGHSDFAPTRKNDPSVLFPWKALAGKGFGLWYSDTLRAAPPGFNHLAALRIIGYDIHDTTAAIKAFRRHFLQDTTAQLAPKDNDVLYDLMNKS